MKAKRWMRFGAAVAGGAMLLQLGGCITGQGFQTLLNLLNIVAQLVQAANAANTGATA